MVPYLIPAHPIETEIMVVNSRFIASLGPVFSIDEAKTFTQQIRAQYPDASHHVTAFLIGYGNSIISHANDDGEPSGTAGRPILSVLQGSGLGDVIAVVTRYFGGTKLGTGGLVRAYSDATKAGLVILPHARKIATHTILVALQYPFLERLRQMAPKYEARILDETFTTEVTLSIQLPTEFLAPFQKALTNLTAGSAILEVIETHPDTILPI